jgi:hypothetical protein
MEYCRSHSYPVHPAATTVSPSGAIATAKILPSFPSPSGGRRTCSSSPLARLHTRAVLSTDAVTRKRSCASTSMRQIGAVCMPASIRNTGDIFNACTGLLVNAGLAGRLAGAGGGGSADGGRGGAAQAPSRPRRSDRQTTGERGSPRQPWRCMAVFLLSLCSVSTIQPRAMSPIRAPVWQYTPKCSLDKGGAARTALGWVVWGGHTGGGSKGEDKNFKRTFPHRVPPPAPARPPGRARAARSARCKGYRAGEHDK